jgi:hypothetical protein
MNYAPEYPAFPDYPGNLAACLLPIVDSLTWYALSEIVDDRFQVSILTGPGHWAEFTFTTNDMTHRRAVTAAVRHLTGRTATAIKACRPRAPGCPCYRITVSPAPARAA